MYNIAWFIVVLPLLGALTSFLAETQRRAAQICVAFTGLSLILALMTLGVRLTHPLGTPFDSQITFFAFNPPETGVFATRLETFLGIHVDSLSAAFGAAIAVVALTVQAWALTWFRGEAAYRRFFWTSSLLVFAVQGFIFSANSFDSLFMWFAGSAALYLMALHWTDRPDAAAPARRVLTLLRAGDVALLLGVAYAFIKFGPFASLLPAQPGLDVNDTFSFSTMTQAATGVLHSVVAGSGPKTLAVLASLFTFAAVLRGAQLPFQVWLSELASAPVPVLALAASAGTLFAAYLVARLYPFVIDVPHAPTALALFAATAALFAALVGLAQRDLIRVGAFAAVVQTGLALAALGAGGFSQGMFILFTATFFNALFLLAAGNVVRVYRTRNLHELGGAWRRMRWSSLALGVWAAGAGGLSLNTYYTLSSALSGATPAGSQLTGATRAVLSLLLVATALTMAFLAVRVVVSVCAGEVARRRGFQPERVREVDASMRRWTAILALVAVVAVIAGLPGIQPVHAGKLSIPGLTFSHFVYFGLRRPSLPVDGAALLISLAAPALGAAAAVVMFAPARRERAASLSRRFEPVVHAVTRALFLERVAHRAGRPFERGGVAVAAIDATVVDGLGRAVAELPAAVSMVSVPGRVQRRAWYLAGGLLAAGILTLLSVLAATGHFWVHTA